MSERPTTTRDRILRAAADLLAEGGRDAVSTRAVAAAARVQAPAIYRLFGDKRGLLDAVAAHGFAAYLRDKTARPPSGDPVDDLRHGWDLHVAFGVANPAVYALMYGDPRPGAAPEAAREAAAVLDGLVRRVAEAGRLRVAADRAAAMIHAAGCGVTLSLIATPSAERDPGLSSAVYALMYGDPRPVVGRARGRAGRRRHRRAGRGRRRRGGRPGGGPAGGPARHPRPERQRARPAGGVARPRHPRLGRGLTGGTPPRPPAVAGAPVPTRRTAPPTPGPGRAPVAAARPLRAVRAARADA
jgi:AcrR family transcriptional regulator